MAQNFRRASRECCRDLRITNYDFLFPELTSDLTVFTHSGFAPIGQVTFLRVNLLPTFSPYGAFILSTCSATHHSPLTTDNSPLTISLYRI